MLSHIRITPWAVQTFRSATWLPHLGAQVLFLITARDDPRAMFDTPKDRHVFPWLEVNTRFGVIQRKGDW